jgi:hypothetical protein
MGWLREQVLNVPIAYQWYELGKPSSLPSIEGSFAPTTLVTILGEKLSTDPQIGQPACCGLCRAPFFMGAVALSAAIDDFMKGCYVLTAWDTYGLWPYADWVWNLCGVLVGFPLQGVHRFELPWFSDMNNRLFVAISTLIT